MLHCVTQLLKHILGCGTALHCFYTKSFLCHFKLVVNTAGKNRELSIIIYVSTHVQSHRTRTETFAFDTQLDLFSDHDRWTIHNPVYYSVTSQNDRRHSSKMPLLNDFVAIS